jgi:pimeloyl-ACP methyl ester carboxylesterase
MKRIEAQLRGANGRPFSLDLRWKEEEKPIALLIFAHGFKGFKDWGHFNLIANTFANHSIAFLKSNFSHNGTTSTHPTDFIDLDAFQHNTFSKELYDLNVVIEWTKQASPLASLHLPLFLMGHSRGGGIVLLTTALRSDITGLILLASVSNFDQRWDTMTLQEWKEKRILYVLNARTQQQMPLSYDLIEDYYDNHPILNIEKQAKKIQVPTLIFHAKDDPSVSIEEGEALAKWIPHAQTHFLEEGGHTFGGYHPYDQETLPPPTQFVIEKTLSFIHTTLTPERAQTTPVPPASPPHTDPPPAP